MWNSIDRRNLSIVLRGVSTDFTARLNKARLIVKQCFVGKKKIVRIPERGIPEKWDKITYRKLFLNKSVRKLKRLSGVRISEAQLYVHLFLTATKKKNLKGEHSQKKNRPEFLGISVNCVKFHEQDPKLGSLKETIKKCNEIQYWP